MWVRFPPGTIIRQEISQRIVGFAYKCLLFFTTQCLLLFTSCCPSGRCKIFETGMLAALFRDMKSSFTLLLVLTAATAFFVVQPVKASQVFQGGPTYMTVPDGGSTMSLLGLALLGVAALRRKLGH